MPTPSNLFALPAGNKAKPPQISSQRICEYQRRFSAMTRDLSPSQIDQLFQTMQTLISTEYDATHAIPANCSATTTPTQEARPMVNEDVPAYEKAVKHDKEVKADEPNLSKREQEVLVLISNGYNRREVGDSLGISVNTAARHISNVYRKLRVTSVAEATQFALAHSDNGAAG